MQDEVSLSTRKDGSSARERLYYFDNFRGIAILLVVAGHCYWGWPRVSVPEIVVANLITGATALFAFISGFFFHHAFYRNFDYRRFMRKKSIAIAVPYLVLMSLVLVTVLVLEGEVFFPIEFSQNVWLDYPAAAVANIATGRAMIAYWYVPFIMLMFVLSPLFIRFIALRPRFQVLVVGVGLLTALVVGRPTWNINPLHSVVYLAGFYMLGILYSLNRERVDAVIARIPLAVLWGTVLLLALGSAATGQVGNLHKDLPWQASALDWMVPLKLAMIVAILATVKAFANRRIPILGYIAETSFAIFFIHPWVLLVLSVLLPDLNDLVTTPLRVALLFLAVIVSTLGIIWSAKSVLGPRSRYLIGY